MNQQELGKIMNGGAVALVGEVRVVKAETRSGTGKVSGKPYTMETVEIGIEVGEARYDLTMVLPDGTRCATWVSPVTKGDRACLELGLEPAKGQPGLWRCRVRSLHKLEPK